MAPTWVRTALGCGPHPSTQPGLDLICRELGLLGSAPTQLRSALEGVVCHVRESTPTASTLGQLHHQQNFFLSPHLELMKDAKAAEEGPIHFLTDALSYGVHLTTHGCGHLLSLVWDLHVQLLWVSSPVMRNMLSPTCSPPRPPPAKAMAIQLARFQDFYELGDFQEINKELAATRGRLAVVPDSKVRATGRGPWRDSTLQDSGPPVAPATTPPLNLAVFIWGRRDCRDISRSCNMQVTALTLIKLLQIQLYHRLILSCWIVKGFRFSS